MSNHIAAGFAAVFVGLTSTATLAADGGETSNGRITTRSSPIMLKGSTYNELRRSIEHNDRTGKNGAAGSARITFIPTSTVERRNGLCRLNRAAVDLKIETRLPSWNQPPEATNRAIQAWHRFSVYVDRHETRHVAIARRFRRKMVVRIKTVHPAATCERLRKRIHGIMVQVSKDHDAAQRAFDKQERGRADALMRGHTGEILRKR